MCFGRLLCLAFVGIFLGAINSTTAHATGENCTINLKDGLKEPGTVSSSGQCCSVLHAGKCASKAADGTYPEAKKLGVSKDTIYGWISNKGMPGHKVGRFWKFKREEIDEWVRAGGTAIASPGKEDDKQ